MQFPNELIALVIQHVDNACTLHAMLSVSKDVFIMAAPALYRRPLWPELSESSGYKLIDWLLTLSVAEDKNTDLLRHIRNIGPQTREGTRPSIDYLSLISAFQWVNISWWGCLAGWTKETSGARQLVFGMYVRSYLTSAVCDHRLEHIQHLSIESFDLRRYTAMAARLRNLSTIYIHFDPHQPFHAVCDDAVLMIEAIQEQHGANLLRACQLSENIFHIKDTTRLPFDTSIRALIRLCSLLPEDPAAPRIPCSDGSFVILNRPLDSYLGELDSLTWSNESYARHYYRDLTEGRFLQRCRSRTEMSVTLGIHNVNIFEWARDEARQRDIFKDKMLPPVPVHSLRCGFTSRNHPPYGLQDVEDALNGFASTLVVLVLDLIAYHATAPAPWRIGETSRTLTLLESINIHTDANLVIHPSLWSNCPSLTKLSIRQMTAHITRQDRANDDRGDSSWLWPVFQLPNLRVLELYGPISTFLHPGSLHHLPRLERLTLRGVQQPEWMAGNRLLSLAHRWQAAWAWSLPSLCTLDLQADISQLCFDFHMLSGCPNLKVIEIHGSGPNDFRFPLRVKPERDEGDEGDKSDVFPQLQKLTLRGSWTATIEELLYLFHHMLPGLAELRLGSDFEITGCNDREWLEATRAHPCCTVLAAASLPMTSTLEELGMTLRWSKAERLRAYHFASDAYGYLPLL